MLADFVVAVADFVVGSAAVGSVVAGLVVFVVGFVAAVGSVVAVVVFVVGSVAVGADSAAAAVETVEIAVELENIYYLNMIQLRQGNHQDMINLSSKFTESYLQLLVLYIHAG